PDYVGPHGRKAKDIKADLQALRAALAGMDKHPDPGARATPTESLSPGGPLSVEAGRIIRDLGPGTDGERISLCDSWWRESGKTPAQASGRLAHWLTLRCSWALESPDRGFVALTALVKDGAQVDPCVWVRRLPGAGAKVRTSLQQAMTTRGLSGCEPGGG
ncbi:MAG: hypothetical protein VX938_04970, partial [Myxococcota bacterium]|nr:hypothetical protein [Myxococcota bacterium]